MALVLAERHIISTSAPYILRISILSPFSCFSAQCLALTTDRLCVLGPVCGHIEPKAYIKHFTANKAPSSVLPIYTCNLALSPPTTTLLVTRSPMATMTQTATDVTSRSGSAPAIGHFALQLPPPQTPATSPVKEGAFAFARIHNEVCLVQSKRSAYSLAFEPRANSSFSGRRPRIIQNISFHGARRHRPLPPRVWDHVPLHSARHISSARRPGACPTRCGWPAMRRRLRDRVPLA